MKLQSIAILKDFTFAVYGAGKSGLAVARFLSRIGAPFFILDDEEKKLVAGAQEYPQWEWKSYTPSLKEQADLWVISPGIPPTHPVISQLDPEKILSEYDLYSLVAPPRTIGVTGTNGKSTVVTWITHLLQGLPLRIAAGGNLGTPMLDIAKENLDLAVLELSSFQLHYTQKGKVEIALLTNLAPNHYDWHRSWSEYRRAKEKLFRFLSPGGKGIIPSDPSLDSWYSRAPLLRFGRGKGEILLNQGGIKAPDLGFRCPYPKALSYPHDFENFAVSAITAFLCGVPVEEIHSRSETLPRLPHRLEYVAEIMGRRFINDSKSTTPHATRAALGAVSPPVRLLAGGKEKGLDYKLCAHEISSRVKKIYAYGECAKSLYRDLHHYAPLEIYPHLAEAFQAAVNESEPGETILLSPGTSSFDEFRSYEERGERFRALVEMWRSSLCKKMTKTEVSQS